MFPTTFLTTLLLALAVAATPVVQVRNSLINLSLSRRLNTTSVHNLLRHDQSRAKALRARGKLLSGRQGAVEQPVTSRATTYIASIGVGSPATTYDLLIDTASSNTWVGAGKAYVQTSTSKSTGENVSVTDGSRSFSGTEFTDQVTLGSLVIPSQSIGVATKSSGFEGMDGVLGIGPVDLTHGTLSNGGGIPTVTDNLFSQGSIPVNRIGISFEPATSDNDMNGMLTWGGTDSSRFTGDINYVPITSTSPANQYWGIDQTVSYNNIDILSNTAGIVDTGTTLILLATDAFKKYQSATGAVLDDGTSLLRITQDQYDNLQNLYFTIGGVSYELTPNAQIWPRSLNSQIGGNEDGIYLVVGDLGTPSGQGLDFINSLCFLERFYTVLDTTNSQIGFATTPFTHATTN